jgi:hypothetical protein
MTRFEKCWGIYKGKSLARKEPEPNRFPYKYSNISRPSNSSYLPTYEDGTVYSEMSAYKIQTPGNYPGESIKHSEQGESLKSRILGSLLLANHLVTCNYVGMLEL